MEAEAARRVMSLGDEECCGTEDGEDEVLNRNTVGLPAWLLSSLRHWRPRRR